MKEQVLPSAELFNNGVEIAYRANEAFDRRAQESTKFGSLVIAASIPGVDIPQSSYSHVSNVIRSAETDFELLVDEAASVFEQAEEAKTTEAMFPVDLMALFTPEQVAYAHQVKEVLTKRFNFNPDEVNFVTYAYGKDPYTRLAVMYTGPRGLHYGSWNDVFSKKKDTVFKIDVAGRKIDTRKAMNFWLYKGFIEGEIAKGVPISRLPDSLALASKDKDVWSATLLTAKHANGKSARIARVRGRKPILQWRHMNKDNPDLRIRPAVEVARVKTDNAAVA